MDIVFFVKMLTQCAAVTILDESTVCAFVMFALLQNFLMAAKELEPVGCHQCTRTASQAKPFSLENPDPWILAILRGGQVIF